MSEEPPARETQPPRRRARRRRRGVGQAPGTLHVDPQAPPPVLRAFLYGPDSCEELRSPTVASAAAARAPGRMLWLDVSGLGDAEVLRQAGERFGLHRLALEDVVHTHQRAKVEEYPGHVFLVLRMLGPGPVVETEQFSLCLGDDFVVTFQERPGDCFDGVRRRLGNPQGQLRQAGADRLAYALLDAVVDACFPVLEGLGDRIEVIEERVLAGGGGDVVGELHRVRREMLLLRRALWPLREVTNSLVRGDVARFHSATAVYLRDVHDHVVQLLDLLENFREMAASMMEVHLAAAGNRVNETMKVLTIIATIFIPLTFVVGVYGMNFENMPELHWSFGYPTVLAAMALLAGGMLLWFRRRGWI